MTHTKSIKRLFVANRGEIAVRIVKACQALGIESVVGVSEADQDSQVARITATEIIGPPIAAESYLSIDRVIAAAKRANCDALHPGYGFLAERPALAQACANAGLIFVGPSADAIRKMGDKITAVGLATEANVPRVPGSGALEDIDEALVIADRIGYPVLVKASAGGGGRGMRVVQSASELPEKMASAINEATSAFGDGTVYLEKFVEEARHIEIQIMGDRYGSVVHLGERDCSTQRRHQKLIEESPSPIIDETTRQKMASAAVELARRVGYVGAGTVEYVFDAKERRFYFLEMNTRIQVEHPVTEMVTGIDLVQEQIRIAQGLPLSFSQNDVKLNGHSIECRINAEDPDKNFLPRPGAISHWDAPSGKGVRVDSHCFAGYTIPRFYDSLLAKLIVHASTREQALVMMRKALDEFQIEGVATTLPFHREMMDENSFINGGVTTRWVEQTFIPARKARQKLMKKVEKSV